MYKPRVILLRLALIALLTPILYACGAEAPPSPTVAPTTLPPTPTLMAQEFDITASMDAGGTLNGLPAGAFQNSGTQEFQPTPPPQGLFESANLRGASNLGAPSWVKPGMRITFYAATATVGARGDRACAKDPNGEWGDQNGDKYKCGAMPVATGDSSAGDALSQIDVLAVEGKEVVLATTLYSISHLDNQFVIAPSGGGKAAGDVIDGVWVHPTRLAEISKTKPDGFTVFTGDLTVEGVTYKAIKFVGTKPDSHESYAYDTKTGLLIEATTKTTTNPQAGANGGTQLYVRRLLVQD